MAKASAAATVKKLPAVRLAVGELGVDASVTQIREWVKEKYGHDLTDAVAQNYSSIAKREFRGKGKGSKAKRNRASVVGVAPAALKAAGNGASVNQVIEAVATLKQLSTSIGKQNLLKLVEAM